MAFVGCGGQVVLDPPPPPDPQPPTAEEACAGYAAFACGAQEWCIPTYFQGAYPSSAACRAGLAAECLDFVDLPGLGFGLEELAACGAKEVSCAMITGLYSGLYLCGLPVVGTLPLDHACDLDVQCASGFCEGTKPWSCGACAPAAGLGEPCAPLPAKVGVHFDCAPGLACEWPGTCIPEAEVGEACGSSVAACRLPGWCIDGTCFVPPPAGTACSSDETCGPNHACEAGTCAVTKLPGLGAACDETNDVCAYGAYCSAGVCAPGGLPGDPCVDASTCGWLDATCSEGACADPIAPATCSLPEP